MLTAPRAGLM